MAEPTTWSTVRRHRPFLMRFTSVIRPLTVLSLHACSKLSVCVGSQVINSTPVAWAACLGRTPLGQAVLLDAPAAVRLVGVAA